MVSARVSARVSAWCRRDEIEKEVETARRNRQDARRIDAPKSTGRAPKSTGRAPNRRAEIDRTRANRETPSILFCRASGIRSSFSQFFALHCAFLQKSCKKEGVFFALHCAFLQKSCKKSRAGGQKVILFHRKVILFHRKVREKSEKSQRKVREKSEKSHNNVIIMS